MQHLLSLEPFHRAQAIPGCEVVSRQLTGELAVEPSQNAGCGLQGSWVGSGPSMHSRSQQEGSILTSRVEKIVAETEIFDIHTHLYDPAFGELLLWGIDDLLNYHYLIADSFRYFDFPYEEFWAMPKVALGSRIWDAVVRQNS